MRYHFRGVRSRENRGGETDNAVHSKCVWRHRFVHTTDQGHGPGYEPAARIFRECEDFEEQQLIAIWEISGITIQCAGGTGWGQHNELLAGEVKSCWTDYE